MNKEEFLQFANEQTIYLDGACGSNLVKAGMPSGVCPEKWILEHRDVMLSLQKAYVEAGTDILYAPTFTANRVKLQEYGLEDKMHEMIMDLVGISKEAAASAKDGRKVYIAGDLTMTGQALKPMGPMELEDLIDIYKEQIKDLTEAGVDLLVVETMMSLAETRAAVIAAKEMGDLAIMATLTFEGDGRTLYGTDAITAGVVLEALGVCAIGVNCSTGPAKMEQLVRDLASVTTIPIVAKPNAGLPSLDEEGKTCYSMDAVEFGEEMKVLVNAGASVLGGCCGTTPEFIAKLYENFGRTKSKVQRRKEKVRYLASERQTLEFGLDGPFMIVGERINPTGKKALQAELREGKMERVLQFAEEQEQCGAQLLDVNMGMSGIDEKEMMLRAIEEVSGVTNLPLSLDSSFVTVLEAALRHYPGRALINSISLESEKFEKLIPIAAKYGAMFILLPLSDAGLPANLQEKKDIIQKIYERAQSFGLCKEDIVVDGLVATVGAYKMAALETLETIRYCKDLGFATICGLSNISFGMPERSYINTAFLTLAIKEGLTMAISNPSQELLVSCALATDLLLNKEGADLRYINYADFAKEAREKKEAKQLAALQNATGGGASAGTQQTGAANAGGAKASGVETVTTDQGTIELSPEASAVYKGVLKGNRNGIKQIVQDALNKGETADALLNNVLLPAINEVGVLFDKGKYFLPQLIASAEAMKNGIEVLEPLLLSASDEGEKPVVIIATVEGDIHDIGKNLVALMLKNYGFEVIDLGKDVPMETIIEAAKEHNAQIIALSALMTTTMQRMRDVVNAVKENNLPTKVMIGGAVVTQEYADEIGADGYSKDAADAVKLAKRLNS